MLRLFGFAQSWPSSLLAVAFLLTGCQSVDQALTPQVSSPEFQVTSGADPELAGQVLAFASDRSGFFNVFVTKGVGSGALQLTAVPGYSGRPNWSHDGRKITFTACRDGDQSCEIYVMNADGSAQAKLTDNVSDEQMSVWSPDDRKIAFVSDRDGNSEIYVMNADGSNQTRLTNNSATDLLPSWSPDGRKIAFQSDREGNDEIYVMNAGGTGLINLTKNPAAGDGYPAWSPRGDKIAFWSDRDGNGEIYVMNVNGSSPTRLTTTPSEEYGPAWSPSGSRIAFASNRDGNFEIYTMKSNGASQTRVTVNDAWDADPAWGITPGQGGRCVRASALSNWWPGLERPFTQQLVVNETFDTPGFGDFSTFGTGSVSQENGKLSVQTGTQSPQSTGLIGPAQLVVGDFDITVDYSDFDVFAPGSPINFGALTLSIVNAGPSAPSLINLERRFVDGSNVIYADVGVPGNPIPEAPYTDTFGQLRLVRVGSIVSLQYRNSTAVPFTVLGTTTWVTDPVQIVLTARNDDVGTGVRGKFDNLRVVAPVAAAVDVIGSNTGQFRGGSFAPGKVGTAFDFSDGRITLPSQPHLSQGFTIEGWVKFDGTSFDEQQEIFNNSQMFLRKTNAPEGNTFGVFVTLADGSVEPRASSTTVPVPGVFYHVAATWDGTILSLYVNGQLQGASTRAGPLTLETVTAQIGRGEETQLEANPFHGLIDELTISDRPFTAREIKNIFDAGEAGKCGR